MTIFRKFQVKKFHFEKVNSSPYRNLISPNAFSSNISGVMTSQHFDIFKISRLGSGIRKSLILCFYWHIILRFSLSFETLFLWILKLCIKSFSVIILNNSMPGKLIGGTKYQFKWIQRDVNKKIMVTRTPISNVWVYLWRCLSNTGQRNSTKHKKQVTSFNKIT